MVDIGNLMRIYRFFEFFEFFEVFAGQILEESIMLLFPLHNRGNAYFV